MDEERYIRLKDGDIYGYTELLARRKDAVIVDAYAAAQGFRAMGVSNELTDSYPSTAALDPRPGDEQPSGFQSIYQKQRDAKTERELVASTKRDERAAKLRRMQEAEKAEEDSELLTEDLLGNGTDGS